MIPEKMLELLILKEILNDLDNDVLYRDYIVMNYNLSKIENRYDELGKEFLTDYALNKTEKSD